jgi:hypothetical protein
MKRILVFILITVFILSLSPIADAKPRIKGSEEFVISINEALAIMAEKDPGAYSQYKLVKKISEGSLSGNLVGWAKSRKITIDLTKINSLYSNNDRQAFLISVLSHEFNHVANRKNKMSQVDRERLALTQEIATLIMIGAPQYMINYRQYQLNNLDNPAIWWWSPAFAK